jgi:metal-responsive CopG/Arc/MetJ family transcriptional regulator
MTETRARYDARRPGRQTVIVDRVSAHWSIPATLKARVVDVAKRDGVSESEIVRQALEDYLGERRGV